MFKLTNLIDTETCVTNSHKLTMDLILFLYQAHIHVLKVKSIITRYVNCFIPWISTSKNLFKEIESVNINVHGRSTSFGQMLVG